MTVATAGVVLAGGQSKRMGRDKTRLALPDGRTMPEHVAAVLDELCDVVLVAGPADLLPDLMHLHDRVDHAGPLAGIDAALQSGAAARYLCCPCDMPHVTAEVLDELLASNAPMTAFSVNEEPRALPAMFSLAMINIVSKQLTSGAYAVRDLLPHAQLIALASDATLRNVNTPDDWDDVTQ